MGVVHFLGVLLEPLMRPLFNVPGVGAFALSMGLAAGYPMDCGDYRQVPAQQHVHQSGRGEAALLHQYR